MLVIRLRNLDHVGTSTPRSAVMCYFSASWAVTDRMLSYAWYVSYFGASISSRRTAVWNAMCAVRAHLSRDIRW